MKRKSSAQRELYELHRTTMFMLCLRYMPTREDAEDVLQEGFIKVFRDLKQFDPKRGKLKTWMKRVFINTALEHLRSKKKIFLTEEINPNSELHAVNDDAFSRLGAKELIGLIKKLPAGYRLVFNMYAIEGYSHKEIAKKLDISVGTSKSQLFKAKAMLRKQIKSINSIVVLNYGVRQVQ
ncbi:MAG: sigma-70 family RNA polymerase sigma factor [Bacteroidota bacterium]